MAKNKVKVDVIRANALQKLLDKTHSILFHKVKLTKYFSWTKKIPVTTPIAIAAIVLVGYFGFLFYKYVLNPAGRIQTDHNVGMEVTPYSVLEGKIAEVNDDHIIFQAEPGAAYEVDRKLLNEFIGTLPDENIGGEHSVIIQEEHPFIKVGANMRVNVNKKGEVISASVVGGDDL